MVSLKDGLSVDRTTYDKSIEVLKRAITSARLGQGERIEAFKRLGRLCK